MPEQSAEDKKLLEQARDDFRRAAEAESETRVQMLDDLRFATLDQWPERIRRQREDDNRPCLTFDRLGQFIRRVNNDARQNRRSLQASPMDSESDPKTAEIIQGLFKNIEVRSNAGIAYDNCRDMQAIIGIGHFRIRTKYVDPFTSPNQEIIIEQIKNPFSVYLDPLAVMPDRRDARYGFIGEWVSKKDFEADYKDVEDWDDSWLDFQGIGDSQGYWHREDAIYKAEYLYIERRRTKMAQLATGEVMPLAEVPPEIKQIPDAITQQWTAEKPQVCWCLLIGTRILEKRKLPGDRLPIFAAVAEDRIVDGKRYIAGLVRPTKDSQRQYNYMASAETETIGLAPRSPWVMYEGQDEGYEQMWANANTRNYAALKVKPVTVNGAALPLPQRNTAEPAIAAISAARMQAAADMNAATGLYDAALGARSNETSGRAILARQKEGENSNFHLPTNFDWALISCGELILQWIPVYYDTERVERIIGEEGEHRLVKLNGPSDEKDENGVPKVFDVTVGKYDVALETSPSARTMREQGAASMLELTKAMPEVMSNAVDLLVKMLDFPGAKALYERLHKLLPPHLQEEDGKTPIPPKVQAMLQQQGQMIEAMTQQLNQLSEELNTKRLELESKERIATTDQQTRLVIAEAQLKSKEEIELLKGEVASIGSKMDQQMALLSQRLQLLNADEPVGEEQTVSAGA